MHAFTALWRVADGSPTRLHVSRDGEPDAVIEPSELPAVREAQRALPPPFDGLPLRLPVSPTGLAAFADAARAMPKPGPADALTELGLVHWAPSWTDHVSPRLWRRLADHGFRITQLDFGMGYSSISRLTLPLHKLEVAAQPVAGDHRLLDAIASLARGRGVALVAGQGAAADWGRARLSALGFEEWVGDGLAPAAS